MQLQQAEKKYGNRIKQMPDGRWQVRIEDGTNIMLSKRENVLKKIAKLESEKYKKEKELKEKRVTVSELAKIWLPYRRIHSAGGTYRDSVEIIEKFINDSSLAIVQASEVNVEHLISFFNECREKKANYKNNKLFRDGNFRMKYWKGIKGVLSRMFDYGIQLGYCTSNPAKGFSVHPDQFTAKLEHKANHRHFLDEELCAIKQLCYQDAESTSNSLPLGIVLDSCIGVRDGELIELRWKDFEEKPGYVHVRRECVELSDDSGKFAGYGPVDHTKTPSGDREIKLNQEARKVLTLIKKYNFANGIPCGSENLVFARIKDGMVIGCTPRVFDTRIAKYSAQIGIVRKSMHDLRRTFATNLYYICKMPIDDIRVLMGHSNVSQTWDYIIKRNSIETEDLLEKLI